MSRKPTRGRAIPGTRIWLDYAAFTAVIVCDVCDYQDIAFSRDQARTLVNRHWAIHARTHKGWTTREAAESKPCQADPDCEGAHHARGLCRKHYNALAYQARQERANGTEH